MTTMLPLMDKDTVRYITQNITPEETQYVADIKSTLDDTKATPEKSDDIIYLTKILGFYNKFKTMKWTVNLSYQRQIEDFTWRMEEYKDEIAQDIQSIIGLLNGADITKIELPVSDNPLEVINELKQCVQNWYIFHQDDIEYEGARSLTSAFLAQIHKYVYLFRYCKVSDPHYGDTQELPNPDAPIFGIPVEN